MVVSTPARLGSVNGATPCSLQRRAKPNDPTAFLLARTIQLQTALDSRIVIEQAKGIVAARDAISPDEAFRKIRGQARSERRKLHDLASEIVSTTSKPTLNLSAKDS